MKKAVHFGAGNIGRGFLGQLYSQSGWETVFVDVVSEVVDALNEHGSYDIDILEETPDRVHVENVRAVDGRDLDAVASEIETADLIGTSVGVNALPYIVPALTKGLDVRRKTDGRPITVVICENLLDAADTLRDMLLEHASPETRDYVRAAVGFAETVIGRMVPIVTEEQRATNVLYVGVEAYSILPIDRNGFAGEPPDIKGLEYHDGLVGLEERKLFTHNCGHALCAYFGYEKGYTYIYEAVNDDALRERVLAGLWESGEALCQKHGFTHEQHQDHIDDLLRRFGNRALGDTVARVSRDPIRKLGPKDRLVGSARIALEYGIEPNVLLDGIASALSYDNSEDEKATELQRMLRDQGMAEVLQSVCGLARDEQLHGMIMTAQRGLCNRQF